MIYLITCNMQDTVSVHKPGFYMKRFIDHISTKVFKKEVKERS